MIVILLHCHSDSLNNNNNNNTRAHYLTFLPSYLAFVFLPFTHTFIYTHIHTPCTQTAETQTWIFFLNNGLFFFYTHTNLFFDHLDTDLESINFWFSGFFLLPSPIQVSIYLISHLLLFMFVCFFFFPHIVLVNKNLDKICVVLDIHKEWFWEQDFDSVGEYN